MTEQQDYFKSKEYQLVNGWVDAIHQSHPDMAHHFSVFTPSSAQFEAGDGDITIENMSELNADIKQEFYINNDIVANKNGAVFFNSNIVAFDQNNKVTKGELAGLLSKFNNEMEILHGLAAQTKDDVIQKLDSADFKPGYGENYVPFYEYSKVEYDSRLVNLVKDLDFGQIDLDGSSDRVEFTTPDNILVDFQANEKDGKSYVLAEITGIGQNGEGSRFITGGLNTAVTDRPRALQMIPEETFAHDVAEFIDNYRIFKESCKECSQKLSDEIRTEFGKGQGDSLEL